MRKKLPERNIFEDEDAILGMPLYMLVMVIIAALGIAIVAVWMTTDPGLDRAEVEATGTEPGARDYPDEVTYLEHGYNYDITVRAIDENGNPISGATVALQGPNIDMTVQTEGDDGEAVINYEAELPTNVNSDTIEITIEYEAGGLLGSFGRVDRTIPVNR